MSEDREIDMWRKAQGAEVATKGPHYGQITSINGLFDDYEDP